MQIDLREDYRWALMRALQRADEFVVDADADADADDATEVVRGDVEQAEPGSVLVHDLEAKRIGALWDFITDVQARIDELAVQEGRP